MGSQDRPYLEAGRVSLWFVVVRDVGNRYNEGRVVGYNYQFEAVKKMVVVHILLTVISMVIVLKVLSAILLKQQRCSYDLD